MDKELQGKFLEVMQRVPWGVASDLSVCMNSFNTLEDLRRSNINLDRFIELAAYVDQIDRITKKINQIVGECKCQQPLKNLQTYSLPNVVPHQ